MNATGLRYASAIMWMTFVKGDTTAIRALMALASAGWTAGLWLPLGTFDRPIFAWMHWLAPGWAWGLLFLLHFAGVTWRFMDPVARVRWGLAINILGFALWALSTIGQTLAVGEFTPSTSLEWFATAALFMAMVRTGLNSEAHTA